jgi:hypothetical protein
MDPHFCQPSRSRANFSFKGVEWEVLKSHDRSLHKQSQISSGEPSERNNEQPTQGFAKPVKKK